MWNCPKCNEASEDNFDSCWKCASGRGGEAAPPGMVKESPAPIHVPAKTNWSLFFAVLLAPAVLTTLLFALTTNFTALLGIVVTWIGSVVSGVVCAGMFARHFTESRAAMVGLTLAFACMLIPASLGLCWMGCSVAAW